MKKFFSILGIGFVLLIIAGAIGGTIISMKGKALDQESRMYIDTVVPEILSHMDRNTLFKYASPNLISSAPESEFDRIFVLFTKLGRFKEYKRAEGQAGMRVNFQGITITAAYTVQVEFETGPANVYVALTKEDDEWLVNLFRIDSKALMS